MPHHYAQTLLILLVCLLSAAWTTSSVDLTACTPRSNGSLAARPDAMTILFTADFPLSAVPTELAGKPSRGTVGGPNPATALSRKESRQTGRIDNLLIAGDRGE